MVTEGRGGRRAPGGRGPRARHTPHFFSSRRRHTRYWRDWSSDVCSSDLGGVAQHGLDQFRTLPAARKYSQFKIDWERQHLEATRDLVFRNSFKDIEYILATCRSEERRVGKERRSRWSPDH